MERNMKFWYWCIEVVSSVGEVTAYSCLSAIVEKSIGHSLEQISSIVPTYAML